MKRDWKIIKDILCAIEDNKVKIHWEQLQAPNVPGIRMTMKGYDLLEVLRDQTLWNRILSKAKALGVKLTYEFIVQAVPVIYKTMM